MELNRMILLQRMCLSFDYLSTQIISKQEFTASTEIKTMKQSFLEFRSPLLSIVTVD